MHVPVTLSFTVASSTTVAVYLTSTVPLTAVSVFSKQLHVPLELPALMLKASSVATRMTFSFLIVDAVVPVLSETLIRAFFHQIIRCTSLVGWVLLTIQVGSHESIEFVNFHASFSTSAQVGWQ